MVGSEQVRVSMNGMKKLLSASAIAALAMTGCAPDEELNEAATEIVGGISALSPKLNAIGTIGFVDDDGNYSYMCSATLVAPSVVLTAKQCTVDLSFGTGNLVNIQRVFFAVGPDAFAPERIVEIVDADVSTAYGSGTNLGFTGLGADLAVNYLIEPITDIEPMKLVGWDLKSKHLGWKYTAAGFGERDVIDSILGQWIGERGLGTVTLRALKGQFFQKIYNGDKNRFLYDLAQNYGSDVVDANLDVLDDWWNNTPLLEDYEAWFGMKPGDAQPCTGDVGGPLVRKYSVTGETLVYGVASASWYSSENKMCDYGTIYSVLGDKSREVVEKAAAWTDQCRVDGVLFDAVGKCADGVATRCSDKWEGKRHLLSFNCADAGMVCGEDMYGRASCVDAAGDTRVAAPVRGTAPTIEQARTSIYKSSRGELNPKMKRFFDSL
jgi:hypothetical protein